jgi:RimJ/RimL family protein N-acetyltransferase
LRRLLLGVPDIVGPWVAARTGGQYFPNSGVQAIGLTKIEGASEALVAGVTYEHYNGRTIAMHVAGEGSDWMTREFLTAAFRYPFEQLRVHKIIGLVDSTNKEARRLDEHLGFRMEARVKDAAPKGDLLIYTMTRAECRFLALRKAA